MGRALWFIASARKFSLFRDWVRRVDFVDKLIVKFYLHHQAHEIALRYFLDHPEYDYLIISSDDLLGSPDHVKLLLQDEEEHGFPVIGGWCNVDLEKGWSALSLDQRIRELLKRKSFHLTHTGFSL